MSNLILKEKGIKTTVQREAILNTVKNSKEPVTIKDISGKCREIVGVDIDLSTIYRILDLYVEKNIFEKSSDNDGNIYYELKTKNHKHFIQCIKCNKRTAIDYCPMQDISRDVLQQTGYIVSEHNLQLRGICNRCSEIY